MLILERKPLYKRILDWLSGLDKRTTYQPSDGQIWLYLKECEKREGSKP